MRNYWLWTAVLLLGVIALITTLSRTFPSTLDETGNVSSLIYLLALLALVGSSVLAGQRMPIASALKQGLVWVGIFAALIVGYTYWDDFSKIGGRVGAELVPSRPSQHAPGIVSLNRTAAGHFGVDAKVNATRISFLIDTGASDVVLTYKDAERAGLEPWNLEFSQPYSTANGLVYGARVRIQTITIGDIIMYDIKGAVMKDGLDTSLLGMSYLDRLQTYEVRGNKMTLRE